MKTKTLPEGRHRNCRFFFQKTVASNPLLCRPDEKQTTEIANQAHIVDYLADFIKKGRTRITESDVSEIHRLTIENIYWRNAKLRVVQVTHLA